MPSGMVVSKTGNGNVLSAGRCDLLTEVVKFKSCRKHKLYREESLNPNLSAGGSCFATNTVTACEIFTLEMWIYWKLQTNILLERSTPHLQYFTHLVWLWTVDNVVVCSTFRTCVPVNVRSELDQVGSVVWFDACVGGIIQFLNISRLCRISFAFRAKMLTCTCDPLTCL